MRLLGKCNVVKKPVPKHRQTIRAYEGHATETTFRTRANRSGQRCSVLSNHRPLNFLVHLVSAHETIGEFLDARGVRSRNLDTFSFPIADVGLGKAQALGEFRVVNSQNPTRPINRVLGQWGGGVFGE